MKNINFFLSENFHFLVVKFSIYLNRHVFVMDCRDFFSIIISTNLKAELIHSNDLINNL